jgi:hypothetical protein
LLNVAMNVRLPACVVVTEPVLVVVMDVAVGTPAADTLISSIAPVGAPALRLVLMLAVPVAGLTARNGYGAVIIGRE